MKEFYLKGNCMEMHSQIYTTQTFMDSIILGFGEKTPLTGITMQGTTDVFLPFQQVVISLPAMLAATALPRVDLELLGELGGTSLILQAASYKPFGSIDMAIVVDLGTEAMALFQRFSHMKWIE